MLRRAAIVLGLVAAIFVITSPSRAHDPIFVTGDQTTPETGPFLPDGTISFALYGRLDAPGDSRGFQVEFADGDRLLIELLIPDRPPENTYEDRNLPTVSVTAPNGSTFALRAEMREPFDEPFSGTSYLSLSRVEGEAHAGIYDVLLTGEVPARFTISVGTAESFFTPVDRSKTASLLSPTSPGRLQRRTTCRPTRPAGRQARRPRPRRPPPSPHPPRRPRPPPRIRRRRLSPSGPRRPPSWTTEGGWGSSSRQAPGLRSPPPWSPYGEYGGEPPRTERARSLRDGRAGRPVMSMAGTRAVMGRAAPATARAPRVDPSSLTDAEVIAASIDRPELFEEIFRRHHDIVSRHVQRRAGPDAGADIASEVFVRAFASRHRFRGEYPSARPWLFGIAANLVRHHYRSRRRAIAAHQRLMGRDRAMAPDLAPESTARAAADLAGAEVARGLDSLRDTDRRLLLAYALSDLTYTQIADAAGIPVGTVRSRLARARQRIRRQTEAGLLDLPVD